MGSLTAVKLSGVLASGVVAATLLGQDAMAKDAPVKGAGPVQSLATQLSLPVNGSAHYFNRATNTAFREACVAQSADKVRCKLDVLGITAQIAHTVRTDYARDASGAITVQSSKGDVSGWSPSLSSEYRSFRGQATKYEWNADSPLARVGDNKSKTLVQNNAYEASLIGQDGVSVCSTVPLSEKRGLNVCFAFDQSANEVKSVALPVVTMGGALQDALNSPAAAARGFNRYDGEHLDGYRSQMRGSASPVYGIRLD